MRTYKALYRSKSGVEITIRSVTKPPRTRTFRTSAGTRKFKLVKLQTSMREVLIVAKTKNRKKAVDKDELEEIEALEELEELDEEEDEEDEDVEEDEDEDEEEPDDEDEDEDEDDEDEPPAKSKKKSTTKSKGKTKSRAAANGKVGTQEVASHFGIDGRALRVLLRRHEIPTDPDSGRYEWPSLSNKTVVRIGKLIKSGEHKRAQREQLDKVKANAAKKSAAKGKSTKSTKSTDKAPAKKRTKTRG